MNIEHSRATRPFGSWPSPVSASLVAGKSLRLGQPRVENDCVYWTETRPEEQGRSVLVRWSPQEGGIDITPQPFSVQSRAHEYGGGAFTTHRDRAWFVNRNDQCIHEVSGTKISAITDPGTQRFADLVFDAQRNRLLAVCEDYAAHFDEPHTTLVAIDIADGAVTTLATGADFYSSPRLSPGGSKLAWLEWNHPDMPWDATLLNVAELDAQGFPSTVQTVAGSQNESVVQPVWRDEHDLLFAADRTDWWNLYAWKDGKLRALLPMAAEFALPHWVFGMQSFGLLDERRVICACSSEGTWRLVELDVENGDWRYLDLAWTQVEHLQAGGGKAVLQAASAKHAPRIVLLDEDTQEKELRSAADIQLDDALLAPPRAVTFRSSDDEEAFGLYYAPANPDFEGPADAAPPMLVKVHGGPTAATSSALDMKIRFWTSRGFAVLDVNYRGSTGYGRRYREKLYGNWGVVDVEDCINGARELASRGLADAERLLISGSSAGGFTVLAALTFHDVFAAGASYYGVADLAGAMRDTAKFESRYGDKLVGPLPATEALWHERSPLFNVTKLRRPVIFFQGLEDRVVPPDQSERMFEAARSNGVVTEYLLFPGEGHGFRQAATIEAALSAEYDFYCRVLGIKAADFPPGRKTVSGGSTG